MEWHGPVPRPVVHWANDFGEERWVNSIFNPVPKIPPVEDIWDKEKEEEEEEEEEGEEEEDTIDKEKEKEEANRIKSLLGVPKQDSVWGLMAWPRHPPEPAWWWEDFSLPPLRGPRLCQCRLRTKMRLHPLPSLASFSTSKTLPSLATRDEPSWLRNQPLTEPPPASRLKTPKAVPRLHAKVSPKRSTVPKSGRQQTPMSMWPPIILTPPSKSSALKGQHTSSAKEASHAPGAWSNPLPHLPSK
ncbi:serine/arginine repetitive matrix protein 1-like [Onychomys torridus]|uniref:serine/arginine repetitive matrix protein 1-like n=1 Tax=Onychomys torridus TaxID=38674 RepID=UPI00167FB77F|nr:serine/arginine repetitive matrix protein 1-like [Onychomys torridus]